MTDKLQLLDLFSGIGGFSLGLERSGYFETVAFCEIEDYPRRVLARHWPEVPCYNDVKELTADRLAADGIRVNAICGGFPCQDISTAGKGAGLDGERSGLWYDFARLIGELRPKIVFVENVAALLTNGMDRVCGSLSEIGYNAEWDVVRASEIGAWHHRARLWLVAYPNSERGCGGNTERQHAVNAGQRPPYPWHISGGMEIWRIEPDLDRVANGVSNRAHRLKGLGNAVVPQIPEILGRAYGEWLEQEEGK